MAPQFVCNGPQLNYCLFMFGIVIIQSIFVCIAVFLMIYIQYTYDKIHVNVTFANFLDICFHWIIIITFLWMFKECIIWIREFALYIYRLCLIHNNFNKYNGSVHQMYASYELHQYLYKINNNSIKIKIKCEICNHLMEQKVPQVLLICGHRFCYSCLEGVNGYNNNENLKHCPVCNAMYDKNIHKWHYNYINTNILTTFSCQKPLFALLIKIKYF